jgi:hypothetical protein
MLDLLNRDVLVSAYWTNPYELYIKLVVLKSYPVHQVMYLFLVETKIMK